MKKIFVFFLFFSVTVLGKNITIMTEDYPPFNYMENAKIKGLSTEIVKELQKRTKTKGAIKILPWPRAYKTLQSKNDCMLYSIARTKDRENQFKWVGPIMENKIFLYKKKGSTANIQSLEDAKKVGSIGVQQNSNGHIYLKSHGFSNLDTVPDASLNVKKLLAGRVDLIPSIKPVIHHRLKQEGLNKDAIENTGVSLGKQRLYLAFSKNTDDNLIQNWQAALDDMKRDGTFDNIYKTYID